MMTTKLAAASTEYRERKAASKARAKKTAHAWKESRAARSKVINPLLFNPAKYKCWLTGNGQKGQG